MSDITKHESPFASKVRDFVRQGYTGPGSKAESNLTSHPLWKKVTALRSELWIDSGDIDAVAGEWTADFSALTTNNSLLSKEVRKGTYDALIVEAGRLLNTVPDLTPQERKLELAFILNVYHALRLVERFDAMVSVEEHTNLGDSVEDAVNYARRLYAVCPERFIVKIPFSPAGILATRRAAAEGIPVNHTLGFSARQNYVATLIGRPAFVNVFLGRLNSLIADNDLGDGTRVGERAALFSQRALSSLRAERAIPTRQIAASLRSGGQVTDLAGVDIITLPPSVAHEFRMLGLQPDDLTDRVDADYVPAIATGERHIRAETLWEVGDDLRRCVDALWSEPLDTLTPAELVALFQRNQCGDVLVDWTREQVEISRDEGKIPDLDHWMDLLARREIGLDSLMNLAGWNSFAADQESMDRHVAEALGG